MFTTLSDRLAVTFKNLRGKGRLSEADVAATVKEIRTALLEADVALPVVREFTSAVRERALGAEVSGALNPAQQVVKIVNEELVSILGGSTRRLTFAKTPPTVIMLAGLQGAGKTTLAGKLAHWLRSEGHTPLLVAADLQRPNAVTQLQVGGHQHRGGALLLQPATQLAREGRLACTLEAGEHDHRRWLLGEAQPPGLPAEDRHQFLVDDLDDLLGRVERLADLRFGRPLLDPGDEAAHHGQCDVGLEQRDADLPRRGVHIRRGQPALAAQVLERRGEPVLQGVEHEVPQSSTTSGSILSLTVLCGPLGRPNGTHLVPQSRSMSATTSAMTASGKASPSGPTR